MAKNDLKKKQDAAAAVPLGTGGAERAKQTIRNRQKELEDRMKSLFANDKKKKKN